jgi:hypothetical protein
LTKIVDFADKKFVNPQGAYDFAITHREAPSRWESMKYEEK